MDRDRNRKPGDWVQHEAETFTKGGLCCTVRTRVARGKELAVAEATIDVSEDCELAQRIRTLKALGKNTALPEHRLARMRAQLVERTQQMAEQEAIGQMQAREAARARSEE